jgi:hypothetical protein
MPDIKLQCLDDTKSQIFVVNQTSGVLSYIDIIGTGFVQATATNGNYQVNNTQSSTNSTTGGIISYGGISIANTNNAVSINEGGALTIAGGMSVNNDILIGGGINGTIISTGNLGSSISTGNIYVSSDVTIMNNLYVYGQLVSVSETIVNEIITNSTTSTLYVTDSLISTNSNTIGNIFTTSANVGIGTTAPESIFQIGNGGRLYISDNDLDYTLIGSQDTNSSLNTRIVLDGNTGNIDYNSVNNHVWYNQETPIMLLNSSGNLGIGISNPITKLDVLGNANISNILSTGTLITDNLSVENINATNLSVNSLVGTTISIGSLYTPNATFGNTITVNDTVTNSSIDSLNVNSITTASLFITNTLNANYNSNTLGSLFTTNGNIGIGTMFPSSQFNILNSTNNQQDPATIFLDKNSVRSAFQTWNHDDDSSTLIIGNNTYLDTGGNIILYNASGNLAGWALYFGNSLDSFDIRRTTSFNITESMFTIVSSGNIGLGGQELPQYTLDVIGTGNFSDGLTTGSFYTNDILSVSLTTTNAIITNNTTINLLSTNNTITNLLLTNGSISNLNVLDVTIGSLNSENITTSTIIADNGITAGNINFTGSLYQNGSLYINSQWTGTTGNLLYYGTSGSVNVGIGTSTPMYTLDINGSLNIQNGGLLATGNSNTLGNLFTTGGNVGINTTVPEFTLDINGITRTVEFLIEKPTGTLKIETGNNATYIESGLELVSGSSAPLYFTDINANNIWMAISSVGNIGIGTTDPTSQLHVTDSIRSNYLLVDTLISTTTLISNNITTVSLYTNYLEVDNFANMYFNSNTLGNIFTTGGNVGINTTEPNYTLDINGVVNTSSLISADSTLSNLIITSLTSSNSILTNLSSSNAKLSDTTITNLSVLYETVSNILVTDNLITFTSTIGNMYITGGNIGINNTNPSYGLDINTVTRISDTTFSDNATIGSLISLGGISITGTNASSFTSGGALTVEGGIAVSQDAYIGGQLYIGGVNTTLQSGLETIGSVSTTGTYQKQIMLPNPMNNTSYKIVGNVTTITNNYNSYAVSFCNITTTGFYANIYRLDALGSAWTDTNLCVSWVVYP